MKTIFNQEDNQELANRLQKLSKDSVKQWGKMTVDQMLFHCQKPLEVAEQKLAIKRNLISFLFGGMMKKKLIIKGEPFKHDLPTAKEFLAKTTFDFDTEKAKLATMIANFGAKGTQSIQIKTHPFFGDMTPEQWGVLFYKHLDHHFKQFGE
jgi:hypothetical protein